MSYEDKDAPEQPNVIPEDYNVHLMDDPEYEQWLKECFNELDEQTEAPF